MCVCVRELRVISAYNVQRREIKLDEHETVTKKKEKTRKAYTRAKIVQELESHVCI